MQPTLDTHEIERLSTARHRPPVPAAIGEREPVHVVYGGAQLFREGTVGKLGALARRALATYGATAAELAEALGIPRDGNLHERVHERVLRKLETEAIEDYRVDFEDGYGFRSDDEEDEDAARCGAATAAEMDDGLLPEFFGLRVKPFNALTARRALRTLDLYLTSLATASGGKVPSGFVVTLPKIVATDEVSRFAYAIEVLEQRLTIPRGSVGIELMVETPESLVDSEGRCPLPRYVRSAQGRVRAVHFGAYDYTAACEVAAQTQSLHHPACDYARSVMQAALHDRGVRLSDGATTVLPVAPHRAGRDGATDPLSPEHLDANRRVVHRAWRLAYDDVSASLGKGFYQGWDLHPHQLIPRYAALYTFFLQNVTEAASRLRLFLGRAAQASRLGDVFDDAATGQGLLNYFLRARSCGALTVDEIAALGIDVEALGTRSFMDIARSHAS